MGFCLPETQVNKVSQILTRGVLNCFTFRWSIMLIRSNKYKPSLTAEFGL
jgi:hypothetical protein